MRKFLLSFILLFSCLLLSIESTKAQISTVYLIRHAEKSDESGNNPGLSSEGKLRAENLKSLLSAVEISAVFSTDYKRTRNTVSDLATSMNLEVTIYQPMDVKLIEDFIASNPGKNLVVCGHSNTIPMIVNKLSNSSQYKTLSEDTYDHLFIVNLAEGKEPKVTILKY